MTNENAMETLTVDISAPETRMAVFEDLYLSAFPAIARFVSGRNGTFQDAKDIFQDALVLFFEKKSSGRVDVAVSDDAYVFGIARHLWLRKFKHDARHISLDDWEHAIAIPDDFYREVKQDKLLRFMETTGKKCLALLKAFYYDRQPMARIGRMFGFHTEHSATVQKYKCIEKLRAEVKQRALNYEDFTE